MGLKLPAQLQSFADRIDTLALRERVLLLVAGIAVLFFSIDTLALQPILASQQRVTERITGLDSRLDRLRQQAGLLQNRSNTGPLQARRERRDTLKQELATLDARIVNQLGALTASSQTTEVLEQVLSSHKGLELVSLDAGTRSLDGQEADPADKTGLSRYQINLVLEGDYPALLACLEQLESLPWKFFWQKIDFQHRVNTRATTHLQFYTLGIDHD